MIPSGARTPPKLFRSISIVNHNQPFGGSGKVAVNRVTGLNRHHYSIRGPQLTANTKHSVSLIINRLIVREHKISNPTRYIKTTHINSVVDLTVKVKGNISSCPFGRRHLDLKASQVVTASRDTININLKSNRSAGYVYTTHIEQEGTACSKTSMKANPPGGSEFNTISNTRLCGGKMNGTSRIKSKVL